MKTRSPIASLSWTTRSWTACGASLLLSLAACRSEAPDTNTPTGAVADSGHAGSHTYAIGAGPSMAPRTQGVPHSNNIDHVTLSNDGSMAISRDSLGGVRLWPSLDGKSEPVLVPIRGARSFSLAKTKDATLLSVVDGVGALHLLRAAPDGSMQELYMGSPHDPILQAEVLKGGERVVALFKDHKVSLLDTQGNVLSVLQERRFRPSSLRLSADEKFLMALSADSPSPGMTVELRPVQIDLSKDALILGSDEKTVSEVFNLDERRFAMSPDGTKVAFLGFPKPKPEAGPSKPSAPRQVQASVAPSLLVTDLASGETRPVDLTLPAHEVMQLSVGFAANDSVLISSRPSGGSWRVSIGEEIKSYPLPSSVANDPQRSAHDYAAGIHLAADGTWLFVQDPQTEKHHYLGYGMFDPQFASLSPDATRVAWTTSQMVFVESIEESSAKSIRITAPPTEAYFRSAFIDDDHLVAVDYSGGLHLIDWKKGTEVGSVDTGGAVREFEVDQSRKLIRGVRQNGGSWLVELGAKGLAGPYLIQNQGYRSGFLRGEKALWTLNAQSRYHSYSLAELRAGLSSKKLKEDSKPLSHGAPIAIDSAGERYFVRAQGTGAELTIKDKDDKELDKFEIPWTPMQTHPSPDGKRVALVSSSGGIVNVYDRGTGKSLWSMSFVQGVRHVNWSGDSRTLAVASQVGAVVHNAETGEQERLGCGPWFEKRSTPPSTTVSFMQVQNLCER